MKRVALALLLVAAAAAPAGAHSRSTSYSSWVLGPGRADVTLELSALDANALETDPSLRAPGALAAYAAGAMALSVGGSRCTLEPGSARALASSPGWRRFEWALTCPDDPAAALTLRSDLLFDRFAGHLHIAEVKRGAADPVDVALSRDRRQVTWHGTPRPAPALERVLRFVAVGAHHVWSGADHLVFLLALLLVAGSVRELAFVITGFTLGHSATLALAVFGVTPAPAAIEALIGLSIVFVAVENVWLRGAAGARAPALVVAGVFALSLAGGGAVPRLALLGCALFGACYFALAAKRGHPIRARIAVAALFGLVHGFGFAAALRHGAIGAGSPVPALLGFNIGVELGQLTIVVAAWPLLRLARRAGAERLTVELGSAAALTCGLFWFLSRAY